MSRAWSWRNAILKSKLPATTKHVLMVISCHMNDMGEGCYPSTKRIAEYGSLSERSVCTHIEAAEKAGWLKVKRHGFDGQGWARHEYRPLWPEGTESNSAGSPEGTEADAQGAEPSDKKALKEVQSIFSDEQLKEQHTTRVCRFDEFWEPYPNKVGKKPCLAYWQSKKLDEHVEKILLGLAPWTACDRWKRGFIMDPIRFLKWETWKDTPPAGEPKPLARGEIRVRELTPEQAAQAKLDARFTDEVMRLRRLSENHQKSDDEIGRLAAQAVRAA